MNGLHGQPLRIPRCWFQDLECDTVCSLQGFCDASKDAYVVYLRSASSSGISVRFVVFKTRVAPAKEHTIPRLELLRALLLVRLMSNITWALDPVVCLSELSCFTESTVVFFFGFKEGGETICPKQGKGAAAGGSVETLLWERQSSRLAVSWCER